MVVGNQPSDRVSIVDGSQTYFPVIHPGKRRTVGWWLVVGGCLRVANTLQDCCFTIVELHSRQRPEMSLNDACPTTNAFHIKVGCTMHNECMYLASCSTQCTSSRRLVARW